MLNNEITWQTGPRSAIRSTLALGLLTATSLFFGIRYVLENYGQDHLLIILALASIVLICITLILRFFLNRFIVKRVSIRSCELIVPRIFLSDYKIHTDDITALDIFGKSNEKRVALIIRRTKPPIAIAEDLFACTTHFEEFISELDKSLKYRGRSSETQTLTNSLASHTTAMVFGAALIIPFAIFADDLGNLNNAALKLGGLTKSALQPGEFYRLFSAFFLHFSLPHLAVNIFTLGILAHPVELLLGRARAINVILISALGAALGSFAFSPFEIVAGASGGILGLLASYTVLHFRHREKMIGFVFIPHNILLLILASQMLSDSFLDGVDSYSHFFGFLVGAVYTNFVCRLASSPSTNHHDKLARLFAFVLSAAFLSAAIYFGSRYIT